jgi:hypothetical protein
LAEHQQADCQDQGGESRIEELTEEEPKNEEPKSNGQDADHLTPMVTGAKANRQALGHAEDSFEETMWLADSNYQSADNLKTCEEAHLDASIPDTNVRKRDSRFATQERPKRPPPPFTGEAFQDDEGTDRDPCPNGKILRRKVREHQRRKGVYRWYVAKEEDCQAC